MCKQVIGLPEKKSMCNESLSLINTVRHCGRYSRIVAINFLFASLGWYSIYTPSTCTTYSNYKPFYVEIIAFKTDDGLQINVSQAKNHSSVSFASKLRKKSNLIWSQFHFALLRSRYSLSHVLRFLYKLGRLIFRIEFF